MAVTRRDDSLRVADHPRLPDYQAFSTIDCLDSPRSIPPLGRYRRATIVFTSARHQDFAKRISPIVLCYFAKERERERECPSFSSVFFFFLFSFDRSKRKFVMFLQSITDARRKITSRQIEMECTVTRANRGKSCWPSKPIYNCRLNYALLMEVLHFSWNPMNFNIGFAGGRAKSRKICSKSNQARSCAAVTRAIFCFFFSLW